MGDGAEWILLQSHEVFGEQAHFLCGFFHVSEYLGAAAPVCRPAQPDQWRRTQQRRLKSGAAIKVIEALEEELEPQTTPEQEAPVRQGHRYLSNRLGHDRKQTPTLPPDPPQKGRCGLAARPRRPNRPLARAPRQQPVALNLELASPGFNHTHPRSTSGRFLDRA